MVMGQGEVYTLLVEVVQNQMFDVVKGFWVQMQAFLNIKRIRTNEQKLSHWDRVRVMDSFNMETGPLA